MELMFSMNKYYSKDEQKILIDVARMSIKAGLDNKVISNIKTELFPKKLQETRSCFVTLEIDGKLRGCIGSLEASQPLIVDVAKNAYLAGYKDKRFLPLTKEEYDKIAISISVLTPIKQINFDSEQDLLNKIRPGIDGLVLKDQGKSATFLPSVWQQLDNKELFINNLKLKAGLAQNYWSDTIEFYSYQSEYITEGQIIC